MTHGNIAAALMLGTVLLASTPAAQAEVLRIENYEAAGISGFRALWNIPVVLSEDGVAVERGWCGG